MSLVGSVRFDQLPLTMTRGLAKPVARIRLEPSEISARLRIEFETAADDLDRLQAAVLQSSSGLRFALVRHQHQPKPGTDILIDEQSYDAAEDLREALQVLSLRQGDLSWVDPEIRLTHESARVAAPPVPQPQPQAPVPAPGMQTSVQLTFSFEIAAMQLTPSFKMGVLKVRPISKLVTMRLPSPQRAQSPLNLQVAFEVVKIQPVAGALGTIRVVPSQQQRPAMGSMPSFAVAGLQVVPNSETAPVQLTPSEQGRASVFITVPFQINTLEFSPTLEIGSVTLNSNSKQVVVQLPGTGPGPVEGAPMFEIANLELNEGGEIVMMQLNLLGGSKRA
jgi:hypothetical protein